jgi:hypothetical protein
VARAFGKQLWSSDQPVGDPWSRLFELAKSDRKAGETDLVPFWVFPIEGGSQIERHVPALPLSRDIAKADQLRRSLAVYRMAFGQSRQEDMVAYLLGKVDEAQRAAVAEELRIDLSPDHKAWPVLLGLVDDDGVEEIATVTTEELSLGAVSSLLDEFSRRRTERDTTLTSSAIAELLTEFASISEGVTK